MLLRIVHRRASRTEMMPRKEDRPACSSSCSNETRESVSASPVASIKTRRIFLRESISERTDESSYTKEQHMQPFTSSTMWSPGRSKRRPSIPTWPNSFTMTAVSDKSPVCSRIFRKSVVFPDPKKPARTKTSSMVSYNSETIWKNLRRAITILQQFYVMPHRIYRQRSLFEHFQFSR
jgi:hypothetical protein